MIFQIFITGIVIFSALHYGAMAFGFNFAEYLSLVFFRVFRKRISIHIGIYVIFFICAAYMALQRNTWLPFLGETVMPSALVPLKTNVGDTVVEVHVSPEAKVVYWSAKPTDETAANPEVENAYDDYSNSGVTQANIDGVAKLAFNKGTDYVVPGGKVIKSHVHYREMDLKYGMMGPVQTVYV